MLFTLLTHSVRPRPGVAKPVRPVLRSSGLKPPQNDFAAFAQPPSPNAKTYPGREQTGTDLERVERPKSDSLVRATEWHPKKTAPSTDYPRAAHARNPRSARQTSVRVPAVPVPITSADNKNSHTRMPCQEQRQLSELRMPVALHFQHPFAGVLDWSPRVDQLRPNFGVRASGLAIRGGRPEVAPARPLGPYALIPNVIGSWGPFSAEARPNGRHRRADQSSTRWHIVRGNDARDSHGSRKRQASEAVIGRLSRVSH